MQPTQEEIARVESEHAVRVPSPEQTTLIASMYGRNFHDMRELSERSEYQYGLALIAVCRARSRQCCGSNGVAGGECGRGIRLDILHC
jgi:hypothetical protein